MRAAARVKIFRVPLHACCFPLEFSERTTPCGARCGARETLRVPRYAFHALTFWRCGAGAVASTTASVSLVRGLGRLVVHGQSPGVQSEGVQRQHRCTPSAFPCCDFEALTRRHFSVPTVSTLRSKMRNAHIARLGVGTVNAKKWALRIFDRRVGTVGTEK